jgi:hypothetical protein
MKRWIRAAGLAVALAVGMTGTAVAAGTPAAGAAPYCGITWGSLAKQASISNPSSTRQPSLVNVRAGQHPCYDRLVLDVAKGATVRVRYVTTVRTQGKGDVMALRGGSRLEIVALVPDYNVNTGQSTFNPASRQELVNVCGYRTFRQVGYGGSFEGYTTVGLGVRARLPFRVFGLSGPGSNSRIVIDVAHRWS